MVRILFIGDVVGAPGRRVLRNGLRRLLPRLRPALVVVNGENAAGGNGLTPATAEEIFAAGCDVMTSGNHIWDRREVLPLLQDDPRVLRPDNYPQPAPGSGVYLGQARDGTPVAVINLMGRVFMADLDCPFRRVDRILRRLHDSATVTLVDFHAETTSEKLAMGWYLDGRVSAMVGTHTHVPTADERVLPDGTAYITDVGMTGPYDSVIGVAKERALKRFLTQRSVSFCTAEDDARLAGVLIEASPLDGRAQSITRVSWSRDGDEAALEPV